MSSTLPETNSSHLKMDGWNTIVSFWDGLFSGAMLVSGSVYSWLFCIVGVVEFFFVFLRFHPLLIDGITAQSPDFFRGNCLEFNSCQRSAN